MIALIRVDLPAPFSPMSEWTSPGKSRKSTAVERGVGAEVDGPTRELEQRAGLHPAIIAAQRAAIFDAPSGRR